MKQLVARSACLLLLAACGSPHPPPAPDGAGVPPTTGGTVVVGLLSDVQSWNPYLAEDSATANLLALVYPSLAVEQPDYQRHPPTFAPALAHTWTWSDDHLELELQLEPAARWSDGEAITSRDVVFSWQAQTAPELDWLFASAKDSIDSVEAVDEHTVRVRFNRRHPYQLMDLNDGPIIPAHAWGDIPFGEWRDVDWSEHVVAGGPFRLVGRTPQQEITLERNPGYFRPGLPFLDRVVFRIVPSDRSLVTQLLAGELDFVRSVPPSDAARVRASDGLELVVYDDRAYTHICWNTTRPQLADPRVRRALTLAIDRGTLLDVVYAGFGRIATGPVLSSFWAFDHAIEPLPFDPRQARALLAEAGWRDGDGDGVVDRDGRPLTVELLAPAENEVRQDIALLIQEDLARVGVAASSRVLEWGALLAALDDGAFDGAVNLWEEPTQIDLGEIWHSPPSDEPTMNFGRYGNPEVDRLLEQVAEMSDVSDQKPLLDRIQELIAADQPYTFLVENVRLTGHSARLRGAVINAATPYFNIDEWCVATGTVE
jgi:peptide/nickel transport system substrate-binding protein